MNTVSEFGTVSAFRDWLKDNPLVQVLALTTSTAPHTLGNLIVVWKIVTKVT
jgi:hypothetical protein